MGNQRQSVMHPATYTGQYSGARKRGLTEGSHGSIRPPERPSMGEVQWGMGRCTIPEEGLMEGAARTAQDLSHM